MPQVRAHKQGLQEISNYADWRVDQKKSLLTDFLSISLCTDSDEHVFETCESLFGQTHSFILDSASRHVLITQADLLKFHQGETSAHEWKRNWCKPSATRIYWHDHHSYNKCMRWSCSHRLPCAEKRLQASRSSSNAQTGDNHAAMIAPCKTSHTFKQVPKAFFSKSGHSIPWSIRPCFSCGGSHLRISCKFRNS